MHHRNPTRPRTTSDAVIEPSGGTGTGPTRPCPWCGSDRTVHQPRGFAGPSDNRDQYLTCRHCGRVTWEIVSRSTRDMRLGRFKVGDTWWDHTRQTRYVITRILRAGAAETLLYVQPVLHPVSSGRPD